MLQAPDATSVSERREKDEVKLKETRQKKGIGRLRAADMTGVGCPHLLRIENGKRVPRIETAMRIATGLGLDPWAIDEFLPALESAEAAGLVERAQSKQATRRD